MGTGTLAWAPRTVKEVLGSCSRAQSGHWQLCPLPQIPRPLDLGLSGSKAGPPGAGGLQT